MVVQEKAQEENQRHRNKSYGKPKESVDINSSEGLNINFRDLIKFVD